MSLLINPFVFAQTGATLAAEAGAFTLTGVNAGLLRALRMEAAAGAFALTGNDAGLDTGIRMTADAGAFTLTGNAAGLTRALKMVANAGSFTLTGNDATLVAGGNTMSADAGAFTLTGIAADIFRSGPTVNADYMYARDITAGTTLYGKAIHTQTDYPSSVTKLMTALIVLRNKRAALSDTVTVQAGDLLAASYSQMGLQENDVINFTDLLYGMLLPSGGDACQAAARVVGDLLGGAGGVARFVTEMNTVATELGMTGTSYANTWGLAEANHYSTARDIGLLMEEVLSESVLAGIIDEAVYTATITGANAREIFMSTTNPILEDTGVVGGKTGTWVDTVPDPDINVYNLANAWQAPNGNTVVIVTLQSDSATDRQVDQRAVIAQAPIDYTYLATTAATQAGFLLMEDGTSKVLLENNTDRVLLEG